MRHINALLKNVLDYIFPRECVFCGARNPKSRYLHICESCADSEYTKKVPRCKRCAEIVGIEMDMPRCAKCASDEFYFDSARVAGEYGGAVRALIVNVKYNSAFWLLKDIAELFANSEGMDEFLKDAVLVPVPLHRKRFFKRGYNQSEVICKALSKRFRIPYKNLLKRVKDTQTQTRLTKAERADNVKNAFKLKEGYEKYLDKKIVVLDDVMTSGATLNECAKLFKKAKFKNEVSVLALARRS